MESQDALHNNALEIFEEGIHAALPRNCIARTLSLKDSKLHVDDTTYDLDQFSQIVVVGAGKATPEMAATVENILGTRITAGLINTKYGHSIPLQYIETIECGHPVPDEAGIIGTERQLEMVKRLDSNALVICLLSGGGSALLPAPIDGIKLSEKQETTRLLLACGASIDEINAVRKQLSRIKGGLFSNAAKPANVITLILSDVIGDRLDTIASGPTYPNKTSPKDSIEIIDRYNLQQHLPNSVLRSLNDANSANNNSVNFCNVDKKFDHVQNIIVGSNLLAIEAAEHKARKLGYNTIILTSRLQGEAREVGTVLATIAQQIHSRDQPIRKPACILSGGETTVTLKGNGCGGRNQELALSAALAIDKYRDLVILSCGTDGTDGPTDATGAIVDGNTVRKAVARGLSAEQHLLANDSYSFFSHLNQLVKTGPTGTNVMDIQIILLK